jgi:hypothetical protein
LTIGRSKEGLPLVGFKYRKADDWLDLNSKQEGVRLVGFKYQKGYDWLNSQFHPSLTESPPHDSLNILSLNCCGIKKRLQYPEFENFVRNHDIICLVESKTDDRDEIKLSGYIFKLKNRKKIAKVKSGGIL